MRNRPVKPGDRPEAKRINNTEQRIRALEAALFAGQGSRRSEMILFVAHEDFMRNMTDGVPVQDDVPSGRCFMYRLNLTTMEHFVAGPELYVVYDNIGTLEHIRAGETDPFEDATKAGDVFYGFYNPDSKRWERVAQGSSGRGGESVWFSVDQLICPDDYAYDDVTETTIIGTWLARSHMETPTDADDYDQITVLDRHGCIYDIVTKAEILTALNDAADSGDTVRGRATYMWDKDDPDGYWHLDTLCIVPNCIEEEV